MSKVINISFEFEQNESELGEIFINGKRVLSFVSKENSFPCFVTLYNWHELCSVSKIYFKNRENIKNSVCGIALYGDKLLIQLSGNSYPRYSQVSTTCPKWILDKFI